MINAFNALSAPESDSRGPDLLELGKSAQSKEEPEDNQNFVLQLYDALSQHFTPERCPYDWESIVVNLRVNWWELYETDNNDTALCFGLFLMISKLGSPSTTSTDCLWRDIQVCVSKTKQVAFEPQLQPTISDLSGAGSSVHSQKDTDQSCSSSETEAIDDFCHNLEDFTTAQLRFEYAKDFTFQRKTLPQRKFLRSSMGIPLSSLIGTEKLTEKMKLSLSFLLVRTFWQYCESEWMQDDWSKESVHFMLDTVDGSPKVVSVHEPFLQARFNRNSQSNNLEKSSEQKRPLNRKRKYRKTHGNLKAQNRTHQYPKLLALGIMLLEIELDRKLEDLATPDEEESDVVTLRHGMATDVLNNPALWPSKGVWTPVKESVDICIKADTDVLGSFEQELRHNFYRRVVGPFKAFLALAWSDADYQRMDPIMIDDAIKSKTGGSGVNGSSPKAETTTALQTGPKLLIGTTMSENAQFTSADWFAKLDDLNAVLQITQKKRDEHSKRIKIAILDTGIQETYYQTDQSFTKSIKAYKDFVSGDDTKRQDGTGHGTSCIRLLQKVYEHAEIYVGRVFEGSHATEATKSIMKKAIEFATSKDKGWGIDVICLPSGFESEYQPITNAISDAKHAKILIFAAASNYGNTAGIFFPAWRFRYFDLFCLFSTTAGAKPASLFNPAPVDDAFNFAILGEDIQLPDTAPLNGTSFSTIIAAGVAAHILDFSMHPDTRSKIPSNETLRQVDGMSAVFATMSVRENKYHCLTPWTLLGGMTPQEYDEEEIRTAICQTISEALKNRNKIRV
ncbi:peptidase S8/S53 domain-containing protein [Lophiotrema nucula]|uniref:Peptidase S8/S53 domain-containing protein n=1 Tax=Lophiotrema nucula TaxID=690887 RepID=A0A6A5ZPE1_9PLEO|nr:peptidase S8/S53 domain-containing protein [Lophiotrema nucula]